jgi:hypothetical protein
MKKLFVALSLAVSFGLLLMSCEKQPVTSSDQQNQATGTGGDKKIRNGTLSICQFNEIYGYVYCDANSNNVADPGEGIAGAIITVEIVGEGPKPPAVTDANGFWFYGNLPEDNIRVCVTNLPPGYVLETAACYDFFLPCGSYRYPVTDPPGMPPPAGWVKVNDFKACTGTPPDVCLRMPDGSPCGPLEHQLIVTVDGNGDVNVVFNQNTNVVDNSYGTNQVGWGSNAPTGKNHAFNDLVGSDKAQFVFFDANGTKVLDILVDYISAKSGTPSGYASLGVSGGEGKVNFPTQAQGAPWVLSATTTLDENLNTLGLCAGGNCSGGGTNLLQTSPPTQNSNSYVITNPTYASWNFVNGYKLKVAAAAFGAAGFGSMAVGEVHNSPPKCGPNAYIPVPCGQAGGGGDQCVGKKKPKILEMKYLGGPNCAPDAGAPCNSQASGKVVVSGNPGNASPVWVVVKNKKGDKTYNAGTSVALNGTFFINGGTKALDAETKVFIYASQGGALLSSIIFHTSCSQPLVIGDKYGSIQLVGFTAL